MLMALSQPACNKKNVFGSFDFRKPLRSGNEVENASRDDLS